MNSTLFFPPVALLAGVLAMGCAKPDALHTEGPTAAMRSAEDLGAAKVPQAALHLQLAEEQMKAAQALNADKRGDEATSMLARAEADAELAIALSQADAERNAASAAMERVQKLQSENPYAPGTTP